jgi:Retroviral aspartyl protease
MNHGGKDLPTDIHKDLMSTDSKCTTDSDVKNNDNLYISFTKNNGSPSIRVPVNVSKKSQKVTAEALIDSGATGILIDKTFVSHHCLRTNRIQKPIQVRYIDRSRNQGSNITHSCSLTLCLNGKNGHHDESVNFYVTDLGKEAIILGTDWLQLHNYDIDWSTDMVTLS